MSGSEDSEHESFGVRLRDLVRDHTGERRHEPSGLHLLVGFGEQAEIRLVHSAAVEVLVPRVAPIQILPGSEIPQLDCDWLLVQPDEVARDWRRGWLPASGTLEHHFQNRPDLAYHEPGLVGPADLGGRVCFEFYGKPDTSDAHVLIFHDLQETIDIILRPAAGERSEQ